MGLNFFKIIQKIESAFMFILLHGGLETIILFVFGEELYNKYKINNNKNNIGMSRKKDKVKGIVFGKKTGKLYYSPTEYSCAVTPQVRQTGNRLSGLAGTAYASLLT